MTTSVVQKATTLVLADGAREVATTITSAEGANLEQANPDETLRQKDPVPDQTLESSFYCSGTIPTV